EQFEIAVSEVAGGAAADPVIDVRLARQPASRNGSPAYVTGTDEHRTAARNGEFAGGLPGLTSERRRGADRRRAHGSGHAEHRMPMYLDRRKGDRRGGSAMVRQEQVAEGCK